MGFKAQGKVTSTKWWQMGVKGTDGGVRDCCQVVMLVVLVCVAFLTPIISVPRHPYRPPRNIRSAGHLFSPRTPSEAGVSFRTMQSRKSACESGRGARMQYTRCLI